jgi:hypothetical protein
MAYKVESNNGDFTIEARTLDTSNTSLALPGKEYSGWGQPYAMNFTKLVENFSGPVAPANSRQGQIWFNTNSNTLQVYIGNAYSDINAVNANHATIADTANVLTTARTISLQGDATGSASFDGSANATITVTLKDINTITPDVTYSIPQITLDSKGRVVAISNGVVANNTPVVSGVTNFRAANAVANTNSGVFRNGDVTLSYEDVVAALGYVPYNPAANTFVRRAGDTITGNITMGSPGTNLDLSSTVSISHALNVTVYGNLRMATNGAQFDGAGNRLQNIGSPQASTDAATKGYVDGRLSGSGGSVTVSTQPPSGGSNGDIWYRY